MSDSLPTTPEPKFSPLRVLLVLVPLLLVVWGGMWFWEKQINTQTQQLLEQVAFDKLGLSNPQPKRLDPNFTDADGNFVADPPSDPAEFIDPVRIVFSYIGAEDSARQQEVWQEFTAALSAALEKPVDYLLIETPEAQLAALKEGRLHVTAVNTGNVSAAVRECGFVPDVTLADASGKSGHTMKLLVPTDSPITKPEQLRGQRIAFVNRRSNSGYKAPLVLLTKDYGLKPLRDFEWLFTYSHDESIAGIASKTYPAAPVASDMLARAEARGEIKPEQYRVIDESGLFPSVAIGHAYNLKPELVAKIKKVYQDFVWSGTGLEKEFGSSGIVKFVPADYKQQWALIRRIDDALGPDPVITTGPEILEGEKVE